MIEQLKAPGKYMQGTGIMKDLAKHVVTYGRKALYLLADRDVDLIKERIDRSYQCYQSYQSDQGYQSYHRNQSYQRYLGENESSLINNGNKDEIVHDTYCYEMFKGECDNEEISRIVDIVKKQGIEVIVGIGSGKLHDTTKAVGFYANIPVAIVPTIVASDAPCSSMSVINTKEGCFDHYLYLKHNPDLVFVDIDFIIQAPARLLVAGMGDALSTYFEARACQQSNCLLPNGSKSSDVAYYLSKLCLESLYQYGVQAKEDVINHISSIAVEKIVEANTLLSGVGFESGGLAAAHAINDGMSRIESCNHRLHGEKVAFATLVQLVLEREYEKCSTSDRNKNVDSKSHSQKEIEEVLEFCVQVGLPVTLEEMGLTSGDRDTLQRIAEYSLLDNEPMHHMGFIVTEDMIIQAMLEVDCIGKGK
ncbi:glycerol dehydrogenase [Anaeromicropila herbilytica]|uniref:Glycerol dehydrogenase n=1 Tax=Anaeromicropila herbilytica TaxID=2785025 RepID=A0A7R7EJ93_9FIRM|nr:glycerol dehydrogenase [Anaeromicropila herbilytica]BCN30160.1 hypothetical protein bsdtb5_14550 [Anaeromicropila herbilytica]